jgi:hypothetical protein
MLKIFVGIKHAGCTYASLGITSLNFPMRNLSLTNSNESFIEMF